VKTLILFLLLALGGLGARAQLVPYLPANQRAGELSYRLVTATNPDGSPNVYYHFALKMVVECQYLEPDLGQLYINDFDNPGKPKILTWKIDSASNKVHVADPCIAFPSAPCYRVYYYYADIALPFNHGGYSAFYGDCCRDFYQNMRTTEKVNFSSFEGADLQGKWGCGGVTHIYPCEGYVYNSILYLVNIPSRFTWLNNSSPVFDNNNDTVLYVCTNNNFAHTFNATDIDGDSLAYSFSASKIWYAEGVGNCCEEMQTDGNVQQVIYNEPKYNATNPLGADVTIDSKTGYMQGQLHDTGSYLVTIAVDEYRNGKKVTLTPHTRDIVLRAFDCSKLPVPQAILPPLINNCDSNTITLPDLTTPYHASVYWDNNVYLWDLGDGDTAQVRYPVHTYDTGTYNVRLITMPGYRCADTAYMKLLVYPSVHADFSITGSTCTGKPIKFTNRSTADNGQINSLTWTFTNMHDSTSFSSILSTPTYTFTVPNQTYSAVLDITTTKGCEAKDTQYINIWKSPLPLQVHDTVLTAGIPYQLYADAGNVDSAATYLWTPASGLDDPFIANPVATNTNDITYTVEIKNSYGCSLDDTVHLVYYKGPDIYIPSAFTPNGDGRNDKLTPFPVGIEKLDYFRVFDRWGNTVYQTQTYLAGWDGNIKGKQAAAGTYIYQAQGKDYAGKTIMKKGYVLLIR